MMHVKNIAFLKKASPI